MATVVITGANRGIGLALAEVYAKRGDEVVAAVRKSSPALAKTGAEVHEGVEVVDEKSLARFAKALGGRYLDIVVNNAGVHRYDSIDALDFDAIREQFEVNALGPLRFTAALLPLLKPGAKVAIVTSRSGSIGDNGSGHTYGYRMSKAAVNMAGVNLAIDLKPRGILVAVLHPGMVATDMGSRANGIAPDLSASRLATRIDELSEATSGKFFHAEGYELPW